MNAATIEYRKKVWQFLEGIQPGNTYTIAKIVKPENREAFVAAVKEYMDGLPFQGYITFNADYTKLYKTTPITFKTKKL